MAGHACCPEFPGFPGSLEPKPRRFILAGRVIGCQITGLIITLVRHARSPSASAGIWQDRHGVGLRYAAASCLGHCLVELVPAFTGQVQRQLQARNQVVLKFPRAFADNPAHQRILRHPRRTVAARRRRISGAVPIPRGASGFPAHLAGDSPRSSAASSSQRCPRNAPTGAAGRLCRLGARPFLAGWRGLIPTYGVRRDLRGAGLAPGPGPGGVLCLYRGAGVGVAVGDPWWRGSGTAADHAGA